MSTKLSGSSIENNSITSDKLKLDETIVPDNSSVSLGSSESPFDELHAESATLGVPLPITSGGTDADNASDARANLGLGNISTQLKNAVDITGGTIQNVTISNSTHEDANLDSPTITGGTATETDLTDVNIEDSTIENSSISGGTITNADIQGGTIAGTVEDNVHIQYVDIENANVTDCNFNGITLTGSSIDGGSATNVDITDSTIDQSTLLNVDILEDGSGNKSTFQGNIFNSDVPVREYWIDSKDGNDSWPGKVTGPFKTLQGAVDYILDVSNTDIDEGTYIFNLTTGEYTLEFTNRVGENTLDTLNRRVFIRGVGNDTVINLSVDYTPDVGDTAVDHYLMYKIDGIENVRLVTSPLSSTVDEENLYIGFFGQGIKVENVEINKGIGGFTKLTVLTGISYDPATKVCTRVLDSVGYIRNTVSTGVALDTFGCSVVDCATDAALYCKRGRFLTATVVESYEQDFDVIVEDMVVNSNTSIVCDNFILKGSMEGCSITAKNMQAEFSSFIEAYGIPGYVKNCKITETAASSREMILVVGTRGTTISDVDNYVGHTVEITDNVISSTKAEGSDTRLFNIFRMSYPGTLVVSYNKFEGDHAFLSNSLDTVVSSVPVDPNRKVYSQNANVEFNRINTTITSWDTVMLGRIASVYHYGTGIYFSKQNYIRNFINLGSEDSTPDQNQSCISAVHFWGGSEDNEVFQVLDSHGDILIFIGSTNKPANNVRSAVSVLLANDNRTNAVYRMVSGTIRTEARYDFAFGGKCRYLYIGGSFASSVDPTFEEGNPNFERLFASRISAFSGMTVQKRGAGGVESVLSYGVDADALMSIVGTIEPSDPPKNNNVFKTRTMRGTLENPIASNLGDEIRVDEFLATHDGGVEKLVGTIKIVLDNRGADAETDYAASMLFSTSTLGVAEPEGKFRILPSGGVAARGVLSINTENLTTTPHISNLEINQFHSRRTVSGVVYNTEADDTTGYAVRHLWFDATDNTPQYMKAPLVTVGSARGTIAEPANLTAKAQPVSPAVRQLRANATNVFGYPLNNSADTEELTGVTNLKGDPLGGFAFEGYIEGKWRNAGLVRGRFLESYVGEGGHTFVKSLIEVITKNLKHNAITGEWEENASYKDSTVAIDSDGQVRVNYDIDFRPYVDRTKFNLVQMTLANVSDFIRNMVEQPQLGGENIYTQALVFLRNRAGDDRRPVLTLCQEKAGSPFINFVCPVPGGDGFEVASQDHMNLGNRYPNVIWCANMPWGTMHVSGSNWNYGADPATPNAAHAKLHNWNALGGIVGGSAPAGPYRKGVTKGGATGSGWGVKHGFMLAAMIRVALNDDSEFYVPLYARDLYSDRVGEEV